MGQAVSRVGRRLRLGKSSGRDKDDPDSATPSAPNAPQWDTTIDRLFDDSAPGDNDPAILAPPIQPRRRRRAPPPPPPHNRRWRRPPPSPMGRRRHRQGMPHAIRTPIVPEVPKRLARGGGGALIATNASFGMNKRPIFLPTGSATERNIPARVVIPNNFKRRPSSRRRGPSTQRSQRLQELLQCPVCLNPYAEPRLLPCGHTYCDDCLNRLMQNDNDIVTCPECRKQHLIPEDGAFPPNFVVRNLLDEQALSTGPRTVTAPNGNTNARCTACETYAPLRLCRHCNFMVCDRCSREHRHGGSQSQNALPGRSDISSGRSGKAIRFFVAVRKITPSNSQVKRLTIEMPMGNFLRDSCEALIQRIVEREQIPSLPAQLALEFGDKRMRHQRTLASYGVQNGDLLFLFNPDERLSFLAYEDDTIPSRPPPRDGAPRSANSRSSSISDIRTATSNEIIYNNRPHHNLLSPISDHDDNYSSLYSDC